MKILILGGDGFCGWPTSLHLSKKGHEITIVDNLSRRKIDVELEVDSLTPISFIGERLNTWKFLKEKLHRPPRRMPLITDMDHYTQFYIRENLKIENYFKKELSEDRYILLRFDDKDLYPKMCEFLNIPNTLPKNYHKSQKTLDKEKIKKNFNFI